MSTLSKRSLVLLVLGAVVLAVVAFALIKRDAIGDLLLKGGDTSLTGQSAQSSPQAKLALDFLSALRASDLNAMTQLTTGEQTARIQQEATKPTPDFQNMKAMMLADLPADSTELRSKVKSVQVHRHRGVVTFETKANSLVRNAGRSEREMEGLGVLARRTTSGRQTLGPNPRVESNAFARLTRKR